MKILANWVFFLSLYIVSLAIIFLFFLESNGETAFLIWAAPATLLFASIIYLFLQKKWAPAIIVSACSFLITAAWLIFILAFGAMKGEDFVLNEQYYKEEFKTVTHLTFPQKVRFLALDDSVHGAGFEQEYNARCIIRLRKSDYQKILDHIQSDSSFMEQGEVMDFEELDLKEKIKRSEFIKTYSSNIPDTWYIVSFHKDKKTIALEINTY